MMAPNVGLGTQGPVQRGWDVWICSVVLIIVSGLFVIARFIERGLRRGIGIDDYLILAALVFSVSLSVTEIEAVIHGYGRHSKELPKDQVLIGLKWFFAANVVYKVVIMLAKSSILFMYYRIFQVDRTFRIIAHIVNVFIILSGIAYCLTTIFQCVPVSGFWNKSIHPKCVDAKAFWVSYATINILTDVILLVLPIRQVWRLRISTLEKFGLMVVFATGCFVTVTTIIRATTLARSAKDKDPTWGPLPATVWSVVEGNAAIIAACLPTLRRPFTIVFGPLVPKAFRPSQQGVSGGQGYKRSGGNDSGGIRSGRSGRQSGVQLSDQTVAGDSRGSFVPKSDMKGAFEYATYGYEMDRQSSTDANDQSDSDSGPIVLQRPDDRDTKSEYGPAQTYSIPGSSYRETSVEPKVRGHTYGKPGEILVESETNISVSHTGNNRNYENGGPESRGLYSYSGSGLRSGFGRQHSFAGSGNTRGSERERETHDTSAQSDLGREYYLRGIA